MPKNILIINSSNDKNRPLINLLEELGGRGYSFYLASMASGLVGQFQENNWPDQKIYLGPNFESKFKQILFILFLPFLFLPYLTYLAHCKFSKKISSVICLNINEKIIFTPIAKLLKIKIVWLEDSDSIFLKNRAVNKILALIYKICSRGADVITFSDFIKAKLKNSGFKEKNIKAIRPGIKLKKREHQDNLFDELANAEGKNYRRKFFTVGTAVELDKKQNIEILFQAAKICLSVIPGMQLIVVGEGEERKNLAWIAKKMEIDGMVWFVGEQNHLKKWLDSFDIFAASPELPGWTDFNITLQAMAAELPIIGPKNFGLEEIVANKEYLLNEESSEALARRIITLYKDKNLRLKFGRENKEKVEKYFTIEKMGDEFKKII